MLTCPTPKDNFVTESSAKRRKWIQMPICARLTRSRYRANTREAALFPRL